MISPQRPCVYRTRATTLIEASIARAAIDIIRDVSERYARLERYRRESQLTARSARTAGVAGRDGRAGAKVQIGSEMDCDRVDRSCDGRQRTSGGLVLLPRIADHEGRKGQSVRPTCRRLHEDTANLDIRNCKLTFPSGLGFGRAMIAFPQSLLACPMVATNHKADPERGGQHGWPHLSPSPKMRRPHS